MPEERRHRVRVANDGTTFGVEGGQSLLDAVLAAGIRLEYGCRRGKCSTCKHYILEGVVDDSAVSPYALLEDEREEGMTLLCQAYARSDCVIELSEDQSSDGVDAPVPCEMQSLLVGAEPVSRRLWRVVLEPAEALEFLPGQYVEVEVPGRRGETRSYSIASSPTEPEQLELIVKHVEGGAFSGQLEALSRRCPVPLRMKGPFGRMYLRPTRRKLLLVGAGSGIAPLLSIVRYAKDTALDRSVRLFYGARCRSDIPFESCLTAQPASLPDVTVCISLTNPEADDDWTGPIGRITPVLARELGDDTDVDAYVCGPPELCDDVTLLLEARGVPRDQIHSDPFYAAG